MKKALPIFEKSLNSYKTLVNLTKGTYLYANSMQTQQRKIPMRGVDGTYKHWKEMLPVFETELNTFRNKIDSLKKSTGAAGKKKIALLTADVILNEKTFITDANTSPFTDTSLLIKNIAQELKGLKGLQLSFKQQQQKGTDINFTSDKPVKLLVGYFKTQRAAFTTDTIFLKEPELETNASADDYGQAEIKISNAIAIEGMPSVNIHTYNFKAGKHQLNLGKGVCLVLGFVDGQQSIPVYDAMLLSDPKNKNIDWLFE